jgi:type IV pilus assembly protein PilX
MSLDFSFARPTVARIPMRRQRGVVLMIALIALVAMTLAGLALVRSIDTGLAIAGNVAFKQTTTAVADIATDKATEWLKANTSPASYLFADKSVLGYYADWKTGCDMTGNKTPTLATDDVVWGTGTGCGVKAVSVAAADLPSGYSATYVITRMCTCDGAPGANICTVNSVPNMANICAGVATQGPFHGIPTYDYKAATGTEWSQVATGSPYYRVVARIVGPRNTMSFIETVVTLE